MIEKEIRYKFLHDMKSEKGNVKWKIGEWKRVKRKLVLGESGLHASCYIQDALGWMQGNTLAEVEVRGDHLGYLDMEC